MPSSPLGTYHKSIFNVFTVTSEYGEVISIESGSSESQKRGYIREVIKKKLGKSGQADRLG